MSSLVVAALLVGCGVSSEPLLRVGTVVWPGYETLYLARDLGMLDEQQVRLVELPASTDVMSALRAGTLEAAGLTLDEVLSLRADGVPLRIVAALDVSNGADALVVREGLEELSALRGHRIGVEQSAVGAVMLDGALRAAGLDYTDVEIVPLTADRHRQAFQAGDVDAVVTYEPTTTQLLRTGGQVLFDSSAIPDRIVDVLAVRGPVVARHRRGLQALVDAQFRALDYFRARPDDAVRRMAPRTGLAADGLLAAYAGLTLLDRADNRRLLAGAAPELGRSVATVEDVMRQAGLIRGEVDTQGLLVPAFVEAAAP